VVLLYKIRKEHPDKKFKMRVSVYPWKYVAK